MRIACLDEGPAGLYFAISTKLRAPKWMKSVERWLMEQAGDGCPNDWVGEDGITPEDAVGVVRMFTEARAEAVQV